MARGKGAAGNDGKGEGDTPAAEKPKAGPRDYIVCREYTVAELVELVEKSRSADAAEAVTAFGPDTVVLVELGPAKGRTPKEARVTAAKQYVEPTELTTGDGVMLNAIPARAITSGRKAVKASNEVKFDA